MAEAPVHFEVECVPVVTFYVGPDKVAFHVHQNLLYDASTVFKAAFSGNFQEGSERSMILPEDDKDSVRRMIQWLYSRKLGLKRPVSDETSDECYMQLAKLNTLADKYDIYLLKNDIVDELFHLQKPPRDFKPPPTSVVAYIYNNTTRTSSFRKLMVAWYAHLIDFEWYGSDATRDWLAEVCHDFAIDLVLALGTKEKYPDRSSPFTLPTSVFHEMPPKKVDEGHA